MITAIIIDDEKNGAEVLQLLIEQYFTHINIIAIEHSAETGIDAILKLKPELVFLDIEMPTATGFDVIKSTNTVDYEIIFTTAYDHYAIKAFKTHAIDYLLKPIDISELEAAIKNVEIKLEVNKDHHNIKNALELLLKKTAISTKKISIPTNQGVIFVNADDIIYLESDSNYTKVFFKDNRKILISKTLKSMEQQLKEYNYFRVHSSYLVNIKEIEKYIKGDGGTLILKNSVSIPVSRSYKQALIDELRICN